MLCQAYFKQGKKNAALDVGMAYIRQTQGDTKQSLIVGTGMLLAFFDEQHSGLASLIGSLATSYGPQALQSARDLATRWAAAITVEEALGSEFFYGRRGSPLAVIEAGAYRPISTSDRLKAGFGRPQNES